MVKYIILTKVILFQVPDKGGDGLGWVDAVIYQWDRDHVLEGVVDGVVGLLKLFGTGTRGSIERTSLAGVYFGELGTSGGQIGSGIGPCKPFNVFLRHLTFQRI